VAKVSLIPGYSIQFTKVYGFDAAGRSVSIVNISRALAAFETMIISGRDAPIDKRLAGDTKALGPDAEIGYQIFTKANCTSCHAPPLFGNPAAFANNGMEYAGKGTFTDRGRADFTNAAADERKFKIPSLREIARTGPYNHAGTFTDLERVVAHYSAGGAILVNGRPLVDAGIDPRVAKRLDLTATQQAYLAKFLREAFASPSYPEVEAPKLP
jgi:cytochrome c peroxidase